MPLLHDGKVDVRRARRSRRTRGDRRGRRHAAAGAGRRARPADAQARRQRGRRHGDLDDRARDTWHRTRCRRSSRRRGAARPGTTRARRSFAASLPICVTERRRRAHVRATRRKEFQVYGFLRRTGPCSTAKGAERARPTSRSSADEADGVDEGASAVELGRRRRHRVRRARSSRGHARKRGRTMTSDARRQVTRSTSMFSSTTAADVAELARSCLIMTDEPVRRSSCSRRSPCRKSRSPPTSATSRSTRCAGLLTLLWHGPATPTNVVLTCGGGMGSLLGPGRRPLPRPRRRTSRRAASARCASATASRTTSPRCVHDVAAAADSREPFRRRAGSSRSVTRSAARSRSRRASCSASTAGVSSRSRRSRPDASTPTSSATTPLLLLHGTDDEILPPETSGVVQMLAGHGEVVLLPGAGHLLTQSARRAARAAARVDPGAVRVATVRCRRASRRRGRTLRRCRRRARRRTRPTPRGGAAGVADLVLAADEHGARLERRFGRRRRTPGASASAKPMRSSVMSRRSSASGARCRRSGARPRRGPTRSSGRSAPGSESRAASALTSPALQVRVDADDVGLACGERRARACRRRR